MTNNDSAVQSRADIEYGPLPAHTLDLHIPQAASARPTDSPFPLVVFVHGGGWRSEDKADHAQLATRIALRTQCCVAVPNYRLSPRDTAVKPEDAVYHPKHAQDILSALTFLGPAAEPDPDSESDNGIVKALDAPYDPRRIFLIGHSCGAHILSSIFLDSSASTPELTPLSPLLSSVKGIAVSDGIFDIDLLLSSFPMYRAWFIVNAFGDHDSYEQFNATNYPLRDGGKHIHWLVIQSPNDTLVDGKQAESMYEHLKELEAHSKHGDTILKDWSSITSEHNEMLKTKEYSDLISNWINSLHFH
ncbi:hypothetical protein ACEPAG_5216 [Sanghuangporus baumii]